MCSGLKASVKNTSIRKLRSNVRFTKTKMAKKVNYIAFATKGFISLLENKVLYTFELFVLQSFVSKYIQGSYIFLQLN